MSKVNEGSLKQWMDGETIHAAEYNNERTLIVKALNDTDKRVDNVVTDMKAPFSVVSNMIADGAVTPSKVVKETVTQYAYDKTEVDQHIANALADGLPQSVIDSIVAGATQTVSNHANNQDIHVTAAKQATWNAKETPEGASLKDGQTLGYAHAYVDAKAWQKHKLTQDNGLSINISGTNLNNLTSAGNYSGENLVNGPIAGAGQWYYIRVQAMAGTWIKQEAVSLFTNTYQMRTGSDNGTGGITWTAWSPDLFQSGVDAKQAIVNSLNAKGQPASTAHTWALLASLIRDVGPRTYYASLGNMSGTGVSVYDLGFVPKSVTVVCDKDSNSEGVQPGSVDHSAYVTSTNGQVGWYKRASVTTFAISLDVDSTLVSITRTTGAAYQTRLYALG